MRETAFFEFLVNGAIASFGAMANYLYVHTTKQVPLSLVRFATNIVLGFFIGQVVGDFLPEGFQYRDGTLLIAGFCVYNTLLLLELKGAEMIGRIFNLPPGFTSTRTSDNARNDEPEREPAPGPDARP
jgi:hypothetical protein